MAHRKTPRRKFQYSQVVPVWTRANTDAVTMAFQALMSKLGITDTASYFRQLRIPIVISVIVCACVGAATYGISGFILGVLAGLLAPAALLWLSVLLVGIAIHLGLIALGWVIIFYCLRWILSGLFGA